VDEQVHRVREVRYQVRDESAELRAVHVRWDMSDGGKRMWWERADGARGLGDIGLDSLPLYGSERLSRWPLDRPVVITEGEKAAQALLDADVRALGTVTGSSGCPGDDALRPLSGRTMILWPDHDGVGHQHMQAIAEAIRWDCVVRWVEPPAGTPKGWDAADAIRDGVDIRALLADAGDVPEPLPPLSDPGPVDPRLPITRCGHCGALSPEGDRLVLTGSAMRAFPADDLVGVHEWLCTTLRRPPLSNGGPSWAPMRAVLEALRDDITRLARMADPDSPIVAGIRIPQRRPEVIDAELGISRGPGHESGAPVVIDGWGIER